MEMTEMAIIVRQREFIETNLDMMFGHLDYRYECKY